MKACLFLALAVTASAEILFKEDFSGDWKSRWVMSTHDSNYGKLTVSAGNFYADAEESKGIKTTEDSKFYAATTATPTIDATKGDGILVFQFETKFEQKIDCGGGYLKLLPKGYDAKDFNGASKYYIMFGPDICGYTKKIHVIFHHDGKNVNWNIEERAPEDELTHLYTLVLDTKNRKYSLRVDDEEKKSGSLEDEWKFQVDKEIDDPDDKKPSDWVDLAEMDDPDDKKPANYEPGPEMIPDPDATAPEDWDEEEDGPFEPQMIPNPDYKGEWKPKRIPNPKYKGAWKPRRIRNPEWKEIDSLVQYKDIGGVGLDLWQVKSGTIIDDIIIADSLESARKYAKETFVAKKDAEAAAQKKSTEGDRKDAPASSSDDKKDDDKDAEDGDDDDDDSM